VGVGAGVVVDDGRVSDSWVSDSCVSAGGVWVTGPGFVAAWAGSPGSALSAESSPAEGVDTEGVGVALGVGVGMSTEVASVEFDEETRESVPELTAMAAPAVPSTAMTVRIVIAGDFMSSP
jgi:hypothetical protein